MKKIWLLMIIVCLNGCSLFAKAERDMEYKGTATKENADGTTIVVNVTLKNDEIIDLSIDEKGAMSFDGSYSGSKKELKENLGMKAYSSLQKEWYEEVASLEQYIVDNGVEAVILDDDGYADCDLISECTIRIASYIPVINEAVENAKESK